MKKIIITGLALLTLTSCGAPKIESPDDALKQNQLSIVKKIEKTMDYYPENGKNKGVIDFDISSKEGKINAKIDYNSDFIKKGLKSSTNLKINLDAKEGENIPTPIKEISGDIDLNLIALKDKIIFKLNSLNIDKSDENPQFAMITGIVSQFKEKWYFMDLPKNEYGYIQKNMINNYKNIFKYIKNNTLLEFVKENENKDFYDYDVKVSEESIIKISEELKKMFFTDEKEQKLTENDIKSIKESIIEINKNITLNIKIDKSNLELFILSIKAEDGELKIENTKSNLNIIFNSEKEKVNFNLIGKKSGNKIDGTILLKVKEQEVFNGIMSIYYNKLQSKFSLDGTVKNQLEELKIKLNIEENISKKSVKIEEPKDAKNFQEVIGKVMGGMLGEANPALVQPK